MIVKLEGAENLNQKSVLPPDNAPPQGILKNKNFYYPNFTTEDFYKHTISNPELRPSDIVQNHIQNLNQHPVSLNNLGNYSREGENHIHREVAELDINSPDRISGNVGGPVAPKNMPKSHFLGYFLENDCIEMSEKASSRELYNLSSTNHKVTETNTNSNNVREFPNQYDSVENYQVVLKDEFISGGSNDKPTMEMTTEDENPGAKGDVMCITKSEVMEILD